MTEHGIVMDFRDECVCGLSDKQRKAWSLFRQHQETFHTYKNIGIFKFLFLSKYTELKCCFYFLEEALISDRKRHTDECDINLTLV